MSLFKSKFTDERLEQLQKDIDQLKRDFQVVLQEWDACSTRVTKMLRRIRTETAAQDAKDEFVEQAATTLPLTIQTPSDRMTRIREQLAARGGKE